MEDAHRLGNALVAGGCRGARQAQAIGHVVEVGIRRHGEVGDGRGKAVHVNFGILEAGGSVHGVVRPETVVGLHHRAIGGSVGVVELLAAVFTGFEVPGGVVEVVGAKFKISVTRSIKHANNIQKLLLSVEERT